MCKSLMISLRDDNGLIQHGDEINIFLHKNLIDILLISETQVTS